MREYSFELEINNNTYRIVGNPLPLTKSLWLTQKLASLLAPLLGGLQQEGKGVDLNLEVLSRVFTGDLTEEEIAKILSVLAFGLRATSLSDSEYENFELVAKNGAITGLEMVFEGDLFALLEMGKNVLQENYGDLGKFLTRLSSGKSMNLTSSLKKEKH